MTRERAYLALGSNLGDREALLREAVRRIRALGEIATLSPIYETDPVGYLDQGAFLNAVAALDTDLEPHELLVRLKAIETAMGRTPGLRNGPRPIDLDILFMGQHLEAGELILPHPGLHQRPFVLVPLADIAPHARVPGLGTVGFLLEQAGREGVRLWAGRLDAPEGGGLP